MSRTHITCTGNGEDTDFRANPGTSLLDALRDELGLTGAKEGCGTGDCGACSVLMDGKVTCACLVFAPEAQGRDLLTVEGLSSADGVDGDHLHPLQQTFLEGAALQCGVCTPGFLVAAKALPEGHAGGPPENIPAGDVDCRFHIGVSRERCIHDRVGVVEPARVDPDHAWSEHAKPGTNARAMRRKIGVAPWAGLTPSGQASPMASASGASPERPTAAS